MKTYLASYRFNGKQYSVDIVADSEQEARERIKALAFAQYDGVLVARLPAVTPRFVPDWLCRFLNWREQRG